MFGYAPTGKRWWEQSQKNKKGENAIFGQIRPVFVSSEFLKHVKRNSLRHFSLLIRRLNACL